MERSQLIEPETLFPKLKPGPGLPPEVVLADQRRRLQGALLRIVLDGGWRRVRVREVVRSAGVSTASFYQHFANADDCFASVLDSAVARLLDGVAADSAAASGWREAIRGTVEELLGRFGSDQTAAQVALIDSFSAGSTTRRRVGITATRLEEILGECFFSSADRMSIPRHLVAGMTGGMLRILRTTVAAGRAAELPRLSGPLADWLLRLADAQVLRLPAVEARRGASRSAPRLLCQLDSDPADSGRRLQQTVIRLAAESGLGNVKASTVRRDAGVSKRQFDELFSGLDECFLEGIDTMVESLAIGANRPAAENWTRKSHRAIATLCSQAAENRRLARVAFLEVLVPGRDGLLRREQLIGRAATALQRTIPADERPPLLIAEASVAAAWHVAQADVHAGRTRALPSVAPLLSYLVMAPIVGAEPAVAAIRAEADEPG
ncbi:MAG: TetR family transcriptional regulator [Actinobacteria bacterium]|nr:TetR family transcriptional regulator [Actinomycetota bacterium]